MSNQEKYVNPTKVITGNCVFSYLNCWEAKALTEGQTPKFSVSLIIKKSDTRTIEKIKAAIAAAYKEGQAKLKGNSKSIPSLQAIKTPLRDGDTERPDDENYQGCYFVNANSTQKPGIVDADCQEIIDRDEMYSGVIGRASISFYAFNSNGNKGIACSLNNLQKIKDGEPLGSKASAESDFATKDYDDDGSLIKELFIDIETYSSVDLAKCGIYKYSESSDFKILLFGYSLNRKEVKVVDIACGETIPPSILALLYDDKVIKYAHNAIFERVCLSRFLGFEKDKFLNPNSWRCHMVWSAYNGLPLSLKDVGNVLSLDSQKMDEGKDLIKYFCIPNKEGNRNLPASNMEKWNLFKKYNKRDVEVELQIHERLEKYPVPDFVWNEYHIDQEINDRGILVDTKLVESSIAIDEEVNQQLTDEMKELTKVDNPNSVSQLKGWFEDSGVDIDSLSKKNVSKLKSEIGDDKLLRVLSIRQQISKSSIKKYQAMQNCKCEDGRARGTFQFYGANHTGRFAGRYIQLQNLPQNHLVDLEDARELVREKDITALEVLYEDIPNILSQLIRTAFIPSKGYKFIVADFSAIEARVIAWYAKEKWRIDAFKNNEDIYCASASQMFHVPVEKHGINGELRQKGKIAELALGYGGSIGALTAMGAIEMGLQEEELKLLVQAWRNASPNIVNFWWAVDKAAKDAIANKCKTYTHGLVFDCSHGMLFITLPSRRTIAYAKPKIINNQFGGESISYYGIGTGKKWMRLETYGPKLVENIVQGTARDILCNSMKTLRDYRIVASVHDELIIETPMEETVENICSLMAQTPKWCNDLVLRADGYECKFYRKD